MKIYALRHGQTNYNRRGLCNGESLLEFRERVLGFLAILPGLPYQTIALVAHEETLRVLYGHFHHLALEELPALSFYNCQILEFEERGQSPFF